MLPVASLQQALFVNVRSLIELVATILGPALDTDLNVGGLFGERFAEEWGEHIRLTYKRTRNMLERATTDWT